MTLFEMLSEYSRSGALAMHMPGHKRNEAAFPWLSGVAGMDITEIEGFDNLNDPEGIFASLEARIAGLWGAGESVCLVNGSTVGILAAVMSALSKGGDILMSRRSHRSVYHAARLAKAGTRYLPSPAPEDVEAGLRDAPDTALVCVTSPTYEGAICDIRSISDICHRHGVPLLVDEAHGAHLGFGGFPTSAVRLGADMVVQSLHKTLPALTQTAVLHLNPGLIEPGRVRKYVSMLQTSSPSYLLSASIDGCVDYLERRGDAEAERWLEALAEFRAAVSELKGIRLHREFPGFFTSDPSKLLFDCDGLWLADRLRREYKIEPEYAAPRSLLAMTGMGDTRESLFRLASALSELDASAPHCPTGRDGDAYVPEQVLPIYASEGLDGDAVPLREAPGRVCGEYVWSYPPGVPLIVPGERIDGQVIEAISAAGNLRSDSKGSPNFIFCVDLR